MLFRVGCRATLRLARARCLHTSPVAPPPLIEDLHARGLVAQVTSPNLAEVAASESLAVYLGVDPTARSLHAGNLLALMSLLHFHIRGHSVIALIGGATGSIGDPGGRSTERPLLSKEALDANVASITSQAHQFFASATAYASKRVTLPNAIRDPSVLNNYTWFQGMGLLEFLRTVGKHAKVNVMIGRDSVKNRLQSENGISFTEFSYQLLQAYDFHVLNRDHNCRVQLGGSDQWGNIVSGIDLIRRRQNSSVEGLEIPDAPEREVFGLTVPLLLTASGAKFGKSAGNAVWLDKELTSYFDLYQFFMHVTDEDVGSYLRMFTLLPPHKLDAILSQHLAQPEARIAQRKLASEVVELVHGEVAVRQAEAATNVLFTGVGRTERISSSDVIEALRTDPRLKRIPSSSELIGQPLTKLAAQYNLTRSRGEAKKLLSSGGLYLNNERVSEDRTFAESDLVDQRVAILRTGKDNHIILVLE